MHQAAIMSSSKPKGCRAGRDASARSSANRADWNVQVVKGKVTSKCLWNACKALSLGIVLMVLGAAMAILGRKTDNKDFLFISSIYSFLFNFRAILL